MNSEEKYYNTWIRVISKRYTQITIKRHIIHHAKQLNDKNTNSPLNWVASMYNLIRIFESVNRVKSTKPIEIYKLLKKYNKNPKLFTPPPGGRIPKSIKIRKVQANSK